MEEDKKLLCKSGLDLELLQERDEDVRMARLMNIQARTEAEEKQKGQRGDIEDGDIFGKEQSLKVRTESEKKLLALKTVSKAARSKQSDLLKKKGFGLVVTRKKLIAPELSSSGMIKSPDQATSSPPTLVATTPDYSSSTSLSAIVTPSNSLSLLGCEYGDSEDTETN